MVSRQYTPAASFWFRSDSHHVRWSRLPAR
jgi:hypothetical protein